MAWLEFKYSRGHLNKKAVCPASDGRSPADTPLARLRRRRCPTRLFVTLALTSPARTRTLIVRPLSSLTMTTNNPLTQRATLDPATSPIPATFATTMTTTSQTTSTTLGRRHHRQLTPVERPTRRWLTIRRLRPARLHPCHATYSLPFTRLHSRVQTHIRTTTHPHHPSHPHHPLIRALHRPHLLHTPHSNLS